MRETRMEIKVEIESAKNKRRKEMAEMDVTDQKDRGPYNLSR